LNADLKCMGVQSESIISKIVASIVLLYESFRQTDAGVCVCLFPVYVLFVGRMACIAFNSMTD